ncbi:YsnF/AvaK domain-containing protein [Paenibacillus sp. CC-CFT747]|nr:YsnF/AvaK domain-containing protein [Paenibacillus sp. CC-CFT747]
MNENNLNENKKIVGVFNTEQEAVKAIEDLKSQGYASEDISVIAKDKDDMRSLTDETDTKAPEGLATGAATGGVLGGVTGLLAGLGALAIPGVGPLIAAGPIAATLTGAAVGAGAGGLVGGLIGMGMSETEAKQYDSYVNEGKILVFVDSDATRDHKAYDTFRTHHSLNADSYKTYDYDPSNRDTSDTATWGSKARNGAHTATARAEHLNDSDEQRSLRLREEKLDVSKERVQTGEVQLHKEVVEENKTIDVPVSREEVVIERHSVRDGRRDHTPIGEDETIRIPVSEEKVEVRKTPVVTGEVSIDKRKVQETKEVHDTVKREEAHIDRSGNPSVRGEGLSDSREFGSSEYKSDEWNSRSRDLDSRLSDDRPRNSNLDSDKGYNNR